MTALELAALIEERLAAIEATKPADRRDNWAWRTYYEKARDLLAELGRDHGGEYRKTDRLRLRLADIACETTISEHQLLRNWVNKARKAGAPAATGAPTPNPAAMPFAAGEAAGSSLDSGANPLAPEAEL